MELSGPRRVEAYFRQRGPDSRERARLLRLQHWWQQVSADSRYPLQQPEAIRASHFSALGVQHGPVEEMKTRTVEAMKNAEFLEPFLAIRTDREYDAAVERLNALV